VPLVVCARSYDRFLAGIQVFAELDQLKRSAADADLVLDQQRDDLFAVHQADWCCVRTFRFLLRSLAEVARRNDQSLFMGAETAAHLLDGRRLDISLPALHLHSQPSADLRPCSS